MKRPTPESIELAKYIHGFLIEYAPVHLTNSEHTLKNYKTSLSLYLMFLQEECGITPSRLNIDCFSQVFIEQWVKWIKDKRRCSAQTCNICK